jgi:hypothetical protein
MDIRRDLAQMQSVFPDARAGAPTAPPERPAMPAEAIMAMPLDQLLNWEIVDMVVGRKRTSEDWRRPRRLIWDKCNDHYKQVYDASGKESWQAKCFQPATTKVVEIITANLVGAQMGPETPCEYQARCPEYEKPVRDTNEIVQFDVEQSKFKLHWTDFTRLTVLLGTAIGKVGYLQERENVMVKERRKATMMDNIMRSLGAAVPPAERFVPKEMLVKDYSQMTTADLYNIYPEPYTKEISAKHWIIEEGEITNKELIAGAADPDPFFRFDNVTDELLNTGQATPLDQDPEKNARRLAMAQQDVPMRYLDPDRKHRTLEYWGPVPKWWMDPASRSDEKAKYQTVNGWIQVVDGRWLVRKRINPYRDGEPPYIRGHYIRVPGEWYGIGAAELMLGLQIEKNELRNTRIDNVNLLLNKIIAVLKDKVAEGEWGRLVSAPGAIWVFKGIDDIRKAITPVDMPDVTKDAYAASQEVDREIQETTGAVKATLGAGGAEDEAGGGTFRGQLLNKQVATERFMLYARGMEIGGLNDCFRKIYQRIYQYKSYEAATKILGEKRAADFEFIPPEDLDRVAKLTPLGVLTLENKGVKLAQMEQFTKLWGEADFFKRLEMARRMWIEMGFPDPDVVLFSDEEMQQYNQFKQMLMKTMPGAGGPGGEISAPAPGAGGPAAAGGAPPSPVAGAAPPDVRNQGDGAHQPALPAQGPGASAIDVNGRPAA